MLETAVGDKCYVPTVWVYSGLRLTLTLLERQLLQYIATVPTSELISIQKLFTSMQWQNVRVGLHFQNYQFTRLETHWNRVDLESKYQLWFTCILWSQWYRGAQIQIPNVSSGLSGQKFLDELSGLDTHRWTNFSLLCIAILPQLNTCI